MRGVSFPFRDNHSYKIANGLTNQLAVNIGNPPQPNYVQLDTGSFELWVNPQCSSLSSSADRQFCASIGSYDPQRSRTSRVSQTTKSLRYGIGSANIQYVLDDIALDGTNANLKQVQFGVATSSQDAFSGILGVGHGENATIGYKNFIDQLEAQGVTATKAYSVALGRKTEKEGVVIFGGVDTSKFIGSLVKQPIVPRAQSPDGVRRFWIRMDSLGYTSGSSSRKYDNTSMSVFLDTGATLTLLPPRLAAQIARDFGSTQVDSTGFYPVDCGLIDQNGTLDFAFPGVTIKVPNREIIRSGFSGGRQRCYLGIQPSDQFVLLGDTFLRSTYCKSYPHSLISTAD
jgi:hypothetical protein